MPADVSNSDKSQTSEERWARIPACDHVVQIYSEDAVLLDSLEGFVVGGLNAGEGVVIIATPEHRAALEERVAKRGIDLPQAVARDQFICLDAAFTLRSFMASGLPGTILFNRLIDSLLTRAGAGGRAVRAFGEMVVLLWNQKRSGAMMVLEHLWDHACRDRGFCLLCAYPQSAFSPTDPIGIAQVCASHTRVITN